MQAELSPYLSDHLRAVADSIGRGRANLLSLQDAKEGFWWAELEANVTITAEYLMLHQILGTDRGRPIAQAARYILDRQIADGSWELFWGGAGDLSTTIEAYTALKLVGYRSEAPEMARARKFILDHGGISRARVFTKIHLALFGCYDWAGTPTLPAWFMLLPPWFPINIYEMSSWARSSTVPFAIVLDKKPIFRPVPDFNVDELYAEGSRDKARLALPHDGTLISRFFIWLDSFFKLCESTGFIPFRKRAIAAAERWIVARQESSGDWAGIIPGMLNSMLALH